MDDPNFYAEGCDLSNYVLSDDQDYPDIPPPVDQSPYLFGQYPEWQTSSGTRPQTLQEELQQGTLQNGFGSLFLNDTVGSSQAFQSYPELDIPQPANSGPVDPGHTATHDAPPYSSDLLPMNNDHNEINLGGFFSAQNQNYIGQNGFFSAQRAVSGPPFSQIHHGNGPYYGTPDNTAFEDSSAFSGSSPQIDQGQYSISPPCDFPVKRKRQRGSTAASRKVSAPAGTPSSKPKGRKPSAAKTASSKKEGEEGFNESADYPDLPPFGRRNLSYKDICRIDDIGVDNKAFLVFIRSQDQCAWNSKTAVVDEDTRKRWNISPAMAGPAEESAKQEVTKYKTFLTRGDVSGAKDFLEEKIAEATAADSRGDDALFMAFTVMGEMCKTILGPKWVDPPTELPENHQLAPPGIADDDQSVEAQAVRIEYQQYWQKRYQVGQAKANLMRNAAVAQCMLMHHTKSLSDPENGPAVFGLGLTGVGTGMPMPASRPATPSGSGAKKRKVSVDMTEESGASPRKRTPVRSRLSSAPSPAPVRSGSANLAAPALSGDELRKEFEETKMRLEMAKMQKQLAALQQQ